MPSTCSAPDCTRPARASGLCTTHYQRARRGAPVEAPVRSRDMVRVQARISRAAASALKREALARGEPVYRTASRWLEERAQTRGQ